MIRFPTVPVLLLLVAASLPAQTPWTDPAPPKHEPAPEAGAFTPPEAKPFERLTFHAKPGPLAEDAVFEDWPRFLGPRDDASSRETRLLEKFPEGGPKLLWEIEKGEGYTGPIISGDRCLLFHRLDGQEMVECVHRENGRRFWSHAYPVDYRDRYGYANGPRGSPVVDGDRVYVYGVTSELRCLHLPTGRLLWKRDLGAEFRTRPAFFGAGSSPLVHGDRLIIPVGGAEGPAVAAFDKITGKLLWGAEKDWGASYASPVSGRVAGEERLFVLAGGESRPPHGGLLVLRPGDGAITARFPWRAEKFESVNASTPLVIGDSVFVSECYGAGGVLLDVAKDGTAKPRWKTPEVGIHWMNPVVLDGHLYAIDGRHPQDGTLVCVEIASGEEKWREQILWEVEVGGRKMTVGVFRGSLLAVDGRVLCLGEFGSVLWLKLSPEGCEVLDRWDPFLAQESWTLPCVSRGLLYLAQHQRDTADETGPRWRCYDLRAAGR